MYSVVISNLFPNHMSIYVNLILVWARLFSAYVVHQKCTNFPSPSKRKMIFLNLYGVHINHARHSQENIKKILLPVLGPTALHCIVLLIAGCDKKTSDHTPVAGQDKNKGKENGKTGNHTTTNDGKDILPPKGNKTAATTAKRKRKSNVEKSLNVLFQKFQDASSSDFSR